MLFRPIWHGFTDMIGIGHLSNVRNISHTPAPATPMPDQFAKLTFNPGVDLVGLKAKKYLDDTCFG